MDTTRIKALAKEQGKTLSYLCGLINRKVYYLNDLSKKPESVMSDNDLRILANELNTTPEYLLGLSDIANTAVYEASILTDERIMKLVSIVKSLPESYQDFLISMAQTISDQIEESGK